MIEVSRSKFNKHEYSSCFMYKYNKILKLKINVIIFKRNVF